MGYSRACDMRGSWLGLVILLGLGSAADAATSDKVRGITVSTHTAGSEWGTEAIDGTFDDVREVGANWVAIHPYARISEDGSVRFRPFDPADPPAHLRRPILEAHERGLKILVKPHLAYWGSPFAWRGEIEFADDTAWRRFFTEYERWIVALARACADADAFAVGTELDATLDHEAEWRLIVEAVRASTRAPLTYAANWTDYEQVPFWDALDAIGIQAYFPLSESEAPSEVELRAAWARRMEELRGYATRHDRYVVFTELGYNRNRDAARRPWEYRVDGPEAAELQRRLTRIALEEIDREHRVVGVFLWKWFPGPRPVGRDFQLAEPEMRQVIRDVWRRGGGDRVGTPVWR